MGYPAGFRGSGRAGGSGYSTPPATSGPAVITGITGSGAASYFTDQYGQPRFLLADNPWALIPSAGRWAGTWQSDIDTYCNNRGTQKYSAIYLDPLGNGENYTAPVPFDDGRTWDGVFPFTVNGTPATTASLTGSETIGLNNSFWTRVDYFLTACARNGMTAMLNVAYTDDFASGGAYSSMTTTQWQQVGGVLAARYASTRGIIWLVGNDYSGGHGGTVGSGGGTPAGNDDFFTALRTGLRNGGDDHIMIIHNFAESDARQDLGLGTAGQVQYWGNNFSQVNGNYTYNVTYLGVEDAYGEANPILVMQLDGYFYQNFGSTTYWAPYDRAFRQDLWWAVTSGVRGMNHGNEGVWQWPNTALADSGSDWFYTNNAPNIRPLIESLPGWHTLIPDTSSALVTSGRGARTGPIADQPTGNQYESSFADSFVTASRSPDSGSGSSLALIYLSHGTTIGIDQTKMVTGYHAFKADPISGALTSITAGSSYNSTGFGNNSQGDPDWLIVLKA